MSDEQPGTPATTDDVSGGAAAEGGIATLLGSEPAEPVAEPSAEAATASAVELALNRPEGSPMSDDHLNAFKEAFLSEGEAVQRAQRLLDLQHTVIKDMFTESLAQRDARHAAWRKEIEGDAEYGGSGLKETVGKIKQVIRTYGSDDLTKQLNTTGLGDSPAMFRFLAKVAGHLTEGGLGIGMRGGPSNPTDAESEEAMLRKMFPKSAEYQQ